MNERIQELMEQAMDLVDPYGVEGEFGPRQLNGEKFAQLIVKECVEIINHRADTCSDYLDSIKANKAVREVQRECAKTIKQHFGVEE